MVTAFGSVLGGIGALASGVKSLFGSSGGTSLYKSSQLMQSQNRYQKDFAKWYLNNITTNQYHAERAGLERAGYNPMLAYMNGSSGVPIPSTNASAVSGQESQAGSHAFGNFLSSLQTASQIRNTNANTALQQEQTNTETFKQLNLSIDSSLKAIEKQLKEVDLKYSDREHLLNQQKILNDMKVDIMNALSKQVEANASVVGANAQMKNADTNAQWTPAKVVGGALAGGLSAFGIGKFGKFGKAGKAFMRGRKATKSSNQVSKVVRDLHTFGKTKSY